MTLLASSNPIHHVLDKPVVGGDAAVIAGTEHLTLFGGPMVTMHMVSLLIAAVVAFLVLRSAAKSIATGDASEGTDRYLTRGRVSQIIEVITLYLRDTIIKPVLGAETDRYLTFLLSIFFFILACNVLGLIPFADIQHIAGPVSAAGEKNWAIFGGTATSNLAVTGGLALIAFAIIQWHGFRSLGVKGWVMHLTGGAPVYLLPIRMPIELLGVFIKPGALAIRLFANMVAGHTLMATLALFGLMSWEGLHLWWATGTIQLVAIIAAVPISFLELFVAFLQAFIFMFLTTVFIGQLSHHGKEHGEHALEAAH